MNFSEHTPLTRDEFDRALPPPWPEDLSETVRRRVRAFEHMLVVLDDDPTGGQAVHGLRELLHWDEALLEAQLSDRRNAFFALTNTRSMSPVDAQTCIHNLADQLAQIAERLEQPLDLLVRGDSTLRGHFPLELDTVRSAFEERLGIRYDGVVLCPFFAEGGRVTAGDIHWVEESNMMRPVALTEFARDTTFGYSRSNLVHWVEEKTGGAVCASDVLSISLKHIRQQGPEGVRDQLLQMGPGRIAIINALTYADLAVCMMGLFDAQERGKRFLFRTSASFVKVRSGVNERPLLRGSELAQPSAHGGLVAVGSYVGKTTRQLEQLMQLEDIAGIELDVEAVLGPERKREIARVAQAATEAISTGIDAVIYTSRTRETIYGKAGDLQVGKRVSTALIEAVKFVAQTPRFLIAKGGITSSDVARIGLGAHSVEILGQILPGVPVWQLGPESRFPGMSYVVFPGNVGAEDGLAEAVLRCRNAI